MIKIYQAFNEKDEGEYIISEVRKIIRNERSVGLNDLVVFYRTHAQSRALEESFVNSSIPYRIVGGVSFYERKEVKDILAYLKMINNSTDTVSLKRIINVPPRGIGDATFKHIIDLNGLDGLDQKFLDGIEGRAKKYLESFYKVYKKIKESSKELVVSDLTKLVIQTVGYKDFLLDGTSEGEARWENVRELLSVTKRFDNLPSRESLETFLQDVSLITNLDVADFNKEAVSLMTIHSAKGLEFDHVFIVGMEENIFPHSQSLVSETEIEEERRLCYVGMTRAKKDLRLIHASSRLLYGGIQSNPRSRFIDEIGEDMTEHD